MVGGAKKQEGLVPYPCLAFKNQEGCLSCRGARGSRTTPGTPAQVLSARNRNPYNFWLRKPREIASEWDEGPMESQEFPLKGLHMNLLGCPRAGLLVGIFRAWWSTSTSDKLKGQTEWVPEPCWSPSLWGCSLNRWSSVVVTVSPWKWSAWG